MNRTPTLLTGFEPVTLSLRRELPRNPEATQRITKKEKLSLTRRTLTTVKDLEFLQDRNDRQQDRNDRQQQDRNDRQQQQDRNDRQQHFMAEARAAADAASLAAKQYQNALTSVSPLKDTNFHTFRRELQIVANTAQWDAH